MLRWPGAAHAAIASFMAGMIAQRILGSIEFAARSAFSWTLLQLFGGKRYMPIPDWKARPYRVLFIRDDGIGDLIVTIEVLRAIAESSPTITLDLLCSPANAPIARTLPFVNEVIVHRRQSLLRAIPTWRKLRRNRYDVVIDGRAAIRNVNKQTTTLMLATGAPWRIGITGRTNDRIYSVPIPPQHPVHWVDNFVALASPFGITLESRDWRAKLPLTADERADAERRWTAIAGDGARPRVIVNPYSAGAERRWPVERFVPVLARLRERLPRAAIAIPTMPGGDPVAERLAEAIGGKAPPLTLPQVIAFTATADLVVSPDTAITVIASAFRVPVVALMRKNTHQWIPYKVEGAVAFSDDPLSLNGLPPERVVRTLDSVIDELGPARGWI
jgi:ADP-heptose:LPS heptosyltransferase